MSFEHTSGPWIFVTLPSVHVVSSPSAGDEVAHVHREGKSDVEAMQNARLIAAAPELLDLLEQYADADARLDLKTGLVAHAFRAIGKARGRLD